MWPFSGNVIAFSSCQFASQFMVMRVFAGGGGDEIFQSQWRESCITSRCGLTGRQNRAISARGGLLPEKCNDGWSAKNFPRLSMSDNL